MDRGWAKSIGSPRVRHDRSVLAQYREKGTEKPERCNGKQVGRRKKNAKRGHRFKARVVTSQILQRIWDLGLEGGHCV